jgi:hypothetical protein
LEPKFVSISPNVGSTGSTLITALVPGVGKGETKIDLINAATGNDICRTTPVVVEYGKV